MGNQRLMSQVTNPERCVRFHHKILVTLKKSRSSSILQITNKTASMTWNYYLKKSIDLNLENRLKSVARLSLETKRYIGCGKI